MKKAIVSLVALAIVAVPVTTYAANSSKAHRVTTEKEYYVDRVDTEFNDAGRATVSCYVARGSQSYKNSATISCVKK